MLSGFFAFQDKRIFFRISLRGVKFHILKWEGIFLSHRKHKEEEA